MGRVKGVNPLKVVIFSVIYWLMCISYLTFIDNSHYPLSYLHKALPIVLLVYWLVKNVKKDLIGPLLALGFSAIGDVLLALSFPYHFEWGLGAFFIAQCCYSLVFIRWVKWRNWKIWPISVLVIYLLWVSAIILPASGNLMLPVSVYMLAVSLMAMTAIMSTEHHFFIVCGALFFVVSDSLIAINKFVTTLPYEAFAIMLTYYIAQYLLTIGIIRRTSIDTAR